MLNIKKLYQVKRLYWYLYPSKETATAAAAFELSISRFADDAAYWSKEFNCNVTYIPENDMFCVIEQDGKFLKVLTTKIGRAHV